jgi:uncharacterized protein (TIGR02246 family)
MDEQGELAAWIDKLAIREVIERYTSAATRGDWDGFEDLWTSDALWEVGPPVNSTVRGASAIREELIATLENQDLFVQMTHDPIVTLHGDDRASATTMIHALARREGHHQIVNYGIYYDNLVKLDGTWRFARRHQQPVYLDDRPLPGHVAISRADLGQAAP